MVALDLENNAIYFGKNGTWENSATSSEISAGTTTNAFVVSTTIVPTGDDNSGHAYFFYCQPHSTGSNITWNFGQDSSFAGLETAQGNSDSGDGITDFYYTPPTGFLGNTTVNLPEPTISPNANTQADDYFTPTLYTSDNIGAGGTQSITGVGFQPDWVWIKNRSSSGTSHTLFDSVRTAGKMLQSDSTSAEASNSQYGYLSSFDSDGFTLTGGTTNANFINQGTDAYVSWNWKAGGTAVSNTDGSITSSVSANTDAGFSIVSYSGNGTAGATVGHGLGKKLGMFIVKCRNRDASWTIYHGENTSEPATDYLRFDTSATVDNINRFNDTEPTSSVFTLGTGGDGNNNGDSYIAYCFAEIEGFSKFGSYTGNGSTDGTFVYTGFRPAWVMVKDTDEANSWAMYDNKRDSFNLVDSLLQAQDSASEATYGGIDFTSNGFKFRSSVNALNKSGNKYIYMAFAENPFKYSTAR